MKLKLYFNISMEINVSCASVLGRNVDVCVHVYVCAHKTHPCMYGSVLKHTKQCSWEISYIKI